MQGTEHQDPVCRAVHVFGDLVGLERGDGIGAHARGGSGGGDEPLGPRRFARFRLARIRLHRHVGAGRCDPRQQHAGVPAAAGAIFHHAHGWLHLEEAERLGRMAILVARGVLCPVVGGQHLFQRRCLGMMVGQRGRGSRHGDAGEKQAESHDSLPHIGVCVQSRDKAGDDKRT